MPTFFARMDSWWKAGAVLVAAVALGVSVGVSITSLFRLPDLVDKNTIRIASLENREREATSEREEIKAGIVRLQCLVISQRRQSPVEDCL